MPMRQFVFEPPLSQPRSSEQFLQRVSLQDGRRELGSARWLDCGDGVVQLLNLSIRPELERKGLGKELLDQVLTQTREYCRLNNIRLRRIWMRVDQKTQVRGRAFLTQAGFHHTSTITGLRTGQDDLVYVKGMD